MHELISMFLTFARVGAFTFGGGYAMLPVLQREVVEKKGWCTEEELIDMYAIGQCTPGVIAVNVATYIGNRKRGALGAVFTTLGIIFPSLVIITIIASFLTHFAEYPAVQHAFSGIRVVVCALVTKTIYTMSRKNVLDIVTLLILIFSFVAVALLHTSPIVIVVICGVIGFLLRGGKKKEE